MKWQVDEITSWQNAKLIKLQVDEIQVDEMAS
jgi:hypothetical protein